MPEDSHKRSFVARCVASAALAGAALLAVGVRYPVCQGPACQGPVYQGWWQVNAQAQDRTNGGSADGTPHGEFSCRTCHTQTLVDMFLSLRREWNLDLAPGHDRVRDEIKLTESDILRLHERCRQCHGEQFDQWQHSSHAVTYSQIMLDRRHNKMQQLNDDCLRCHGMFFDGTIHDLVEPVDTQGPWRLVKQQLADEPTIPCLACHQIHPRQHTVSSPSTTPRLVTDDSGAIPCGFYDRREKHFFAAHQLPHPRIWEGDDELALAADQRIRVCYQCHAPTVAHRAGTGDDKTLRGVHAKLSCFDCHQDHSLNPRASCANCHPADSHCGLDVRRLDTSYRAKTSNNDIHQVSCQDCHRQNAPGR